MWSPAYPLVAGLLYFWREQLSEVNNTERQFPCKTRDCPNTFGRVKHGRREYCDECRVDRRQTSNREAARDKVANKPISAVEQTSILKGDWKIRNANVLKQCLENGLERANELGVAPSRPYWLEGSTSPLITDEIGGRSEVLSMRELYALYCFTARGLKVLGVELSFEEWLNLRDRCRKDLWFLAVEVLGIRLVEEVHREIIENIYPHFNCEGMFTVDYTLPDMYAAMDRQCETKEITILDPREWLKTLVANSFVLQFLLNFPEGRVFNVSGSEELALTSIQLQKGHLGNNAAMRSLFPEYTLRGVDITSKAPILLPCRRHYQRDPSYSTFSCMGAASGKHCDLFVADDIVQEKGSEITRASLKEKADGLLSNVPSAHAIKLILGTRYDLEYWYSHRIALLESNPTSMKFHSRGVMEILPEYVNVPYRDFAMHMVKLNWSNRYGSPEKTFKAYQRKIATSESDFRHQQMNNPISAEEADNKIAFDEDELKNLIVDPDPFPANAEQYLVVDVAWSTDNRADFSCLIVGRVGESTMSSSEKMSAYIDSIDAQRRRSSELALAIVETSMKYPLKSIIIEKVNGVEPIVDECRRLAHLRNHTLPFIWAAPVILTTNAKWRRIKNLQLLIAQSRLWFSSQISQAGKALMLVQFGKYKGKRSSTRHDDVCDCIALFAEHCLPKEDATKNAAAAKAREEAKEEANARAQYDHIFGGPGGFVSNASDWGQRQTSDDPVSVDDNGGRSNWSWLRLNGR